MNCFLITSPFQILNAIEAIHHFNLTNNALIILQTGLFGKRHYANLIDMHHWVTVDYFNLHKRFTHYDFGAVRPRNTYEKLLELHLTFSQFMKRTRLDRLARSVGSVENLILGSYRSDYDLHFRHFANRVNCKNIYVIDVGTNTLDFERQSTTDSSPPILSDNTDANLAKRIGRALRNKFIDWDTLGLKSVTFFSCYDCDGNENTRVIKNEYKHLKSLLRTSSVSDSVWFLGESSVDDGLMSFDAYLKCLTRMRAYFGSTDLVYVPHPRESDEYVQVIARQLDCGIERFNVPIEYALVAGGKRPKCIASFCSSALINCSIIFGESIDIKSFYLREEHLLRSKDMVERFYSYFASGKSGRIEVIHNY